LLVVSKFCLRSEHNPVQNIFRTVCFWLFYKNRFIKKPSFFGGGGATLPCGGSILFHLCRLSNGIKEKCFRVAAKWTCSVQMFCLCGFKWLLKHVLDWLRNRIWIGTIRTVCAVCVQFDVSNLSPFILSSPQGPSADVFYPLSIPCAALLTYSTPSCKPITLNHVLDSDRSKNISTHSCHLTRFNQPYWFYEM